MYLNNLWPRRNYSADGLLNKEGLIITPSGAYKKVANSNDNNVQENFEWLYIP